jgi:thiosulfate dehydrogenase [quinone] large subunit
MHTGETLEQPATPSAITDSPIARFLFSDPRMGWVWLPLRVWLGYQWLNSGWGKFTNPAWIGDGSALKSFFERAVVMEPRPVASFDWYRSFLQIMLDTGAYTWFAKIVLFGELAVGLALVLGAFTGIAAFFGGFLNLNFGLAGTASTNPLLFVVATWLVLAWKTAGWIGLDRWLLRWLGTPWAPGYLFGQRSG